MSSALAESQAEYDVHHELAEDDRVRSQVWGLLAAMDPRGHRLERRSESRHPYPYLVYLSPVRGDGKTPCGDPVVVVGKHLSERGLSFYHPMPLPFRRVIVTLETANGGRMGFLVNLTWCRFTQHGWYESGGRFLDVVPSPIPVEE